MTIFDNFSLLSFCCLLNIHSWAHAAAACFWKLRTSFGLVNTFPGPASRVVKFLEAAQDGVSPVVVTAAGPTHITYHRLCGVHLELFL